MTTEFQSHVDVRTNSRLTVGNQIDLLPNAQSGDLKLALIDKATTSIYITTFQIVCDEVGKQFTEALISAAKRGVEIRFLVTGGPWTWAFSGNCPSKMRKNGIEVATMPYSYITNHGVVQLHDKIFIIDSSLAIVGGQNIGTWYAKKKEADGNFRDTDAIVSGPVIEDIRARFAMLWRFAKPSDNTLKKGPPLKIEREKYASWLQMKPLKGVCRFVSQTPSQKEFLVFESYRLHALQTQKRLIFHSLALNAFGSPEQENLWRSFNDISKEPGSEIFLLTNGPGFINSDMMPSWVGRIVGYYFLNSVYDSLKGTAVKGFAYPAWLHSKVYFFDNLAIGIGSFNFDETGLVWTESTLICLDTELIKQTLRMFKSDLASSYNIKAI